MMQLHWGDISLETFMKEYWQKQPLLLKNAFQHFVDPISGDELAGLAMEDDVQSRITSHTDNNNWQVEHGPFSSFDHLGDHSWTLLVQAVNNWSGETQALLTPFKFIPNWRIDDVMVSFSTPHGGVGAHLDQYDVFIIQGSGKRRWQVGAPDDSLMSLLPHADLKQVSSFTPIIDEITEPGDLLYIPPNHPHQGIAIENSMNFSVGFQAPNSQELWSSFADRLLDESLGEARFPDPQRHKTTTPEQLEPSDINALKQFMLTQFDTVCFSDFIGKYLSQSHHCLDLFEPEQAFLETDLLELINEPELTLQPVLGIKALYIDEGKALYLNGQKFALDEQTIHLGQALARNNHLTMEDLKSFIGCLKNRQLLTSVLNKGFWFIE